MALKETDEVIGLGGAKAFAYYCMSVNTASKGLARKFGFVYDGVNQETRRHDNRVFDIERYILSRDAYMDLKV